MRMTLYNRCRTMWLLLLSSILLLFDGIPPVSGFAAWIKCHVDLFDEDEVIMNNMIVPAAQAVHQGVTIEVKRAQDDDWSSTFEYPADTSTIITARLKVPPSLSEQDVQFVMDALSPGTVFKQSLCGGRRVTSTHHGHAVVLEIDGSTNTVELVAGYAAGHEAVTLTPTLILRRQPTAAEEL